MSTTKDKTTSKINPTADTDNAPSVRIMAKRNASLSGIVTGFEANAKNHEWCIADAKRLKVAKTGKASVTDTEGDAIRFLDASTFRAIAKQYDAKSRGRLSHEACASYLTALEMLTKVGVI